MAGFSHITVEKLSGTPNPMKTSLLVALSLLLACSRLSAVEGSATANGVTVQGKEKTISNTGSDKTITVNVTVKNGSFKELPEGEMEYSLIIDRSDYSPRRLLLTGTGKIPPLKVAQVFQVQAGVATYMQGWGTVKFYFKIVVKHNGKETVVAMSNPSFNSLAATSAKVEGRGGVLATGYNIIEGALH